MQLIDLKKLSERISISVPTIRKYLGKGMPHYKLDRKILVDPDEVGEWIKDRFRVETQDEWAEMVDEMAETLLAK